MTQAACEGCLWVGMACHPKLVLGRVGILRLVMRD
jgi:hypothetical protein